MRQSQCSAFAKIDCNMLDYVLDITEERWMIQSQLQSCSNLVDFFLKHFGVHDPIVLPRKAEHSFVVSRK